MIEQDQNKETLSEKSAKINEGTVIQENQPPVSDPPKKGTKKRKELGWFWAGGAGACLVILVICLIGFLTPEYRHSNYYICEDPSMLKALLSTDLNPGDSMAVAIASQNEDIQRKDAIEDLLEQKVIVSSEEFASNISGYYNTLIAVLAAILIILNLFGFLSWRSNANVSLEQKQRELDDMVNTIDDRLVNNLEEILIKNQVVKDKLQSFLREMLEQQETLSEEEWDKLHLLLKKYEMQVDLKEISEENDEKNDGEIEQVY